MMAGTTSLRVPIVANQWQMFSYAKEGNVYKLYLNGIEVDTETITQSPANNSYWTI